MSSNPETSARRMEKGNQASLTDIVQTEMLPPGYLLPTPVAHDATENIIGPANHRPHDEDTLAMALHHLLPTPVSDHSRGLAQPGTDFSSLPNVAISLLPTPRAQNGEIRNQNIYARPLEQPQNLENALALLPTPTVMDMGSNYTPEEWEAWKLKQKETHSNGNGHGASLTQEALSLLPTPTVADTRDGKYLRQMTIDALKRGASTGLNLNHLVETLWEEMAYGSTGESMTQPLKDGSECLEEKHQTQLFPE